MGTCGTGLKGGVLKDDADLSKLSIAAGAKIMLMGSRDELPPEPTTKTVFAEDLPSPVDVVVRPADAMFTGHFGSWSVVPSDPADRASELLGFTQFVRILNFFERPIGGDRGVHYGLNGQWIQDRASGGGAPWGSIEGGIFVSRKLGLRHVYTRVYAHVYAHVTWLHVRPRASSASGMRA